MIHWIIAESKYKYVSRVHQHSHPRNSNDLVKVSLYVWNDLIGRNSNLENPIGRI